MASQKKQKTTSRQRASGRKPASAPTVNFSTRLSTTQAELVEQAAEIKQWSPARLLREAAVTRAWNIVNARPSEALLRDLAGVISRQILDPRAKYSWFRDPDDHGEAELSFLSPDYVRPLDDEDLVQYGPPRVRRPSDPELRQIRTALETCATEFVRMVLDEWDRIESQEGEYEPEVPGDPLLGTVVDD